ncbi:hypothetical protein C5167_006449 [Papaver somniferum]|uniref:Uncharacterized protein n=1 Tax=Papaver somniferum TaxID=3469 RepID=A0A4Y7JGH5_PAPSO|nr:hypothetical protein C5167_006449 [Papaver somniferum]
MERQETSILLYLREREFDSKMNLSGQGLVPVSEQDSQSSPWKKELVLKVREHEEEILQLRKHLGEYSIRAAQQERSIFISSLLPLLEDYSLQPPVLDAQSIVSNLKAKLKESHYQLAPWRSESLNPPSFTPQSQSQAQSPSRSPALNTSQNKNGLELVPQPAYSHSQTPISARANAQAATDWNSLGQHTHQTDFVGDGSKSPEPDNLGQPFPSTSRNPATQDVSLNISQGGFRNKHFSEENAAKQLSFNNDYLGSGGMDDPDAVGLDSGREPSLHWSSGNSPYMTPTHDDPGTSYSPYLPAVLEEPSSSFSEAAEDDPLPGIEGLQISGEAFPGRDLQACGYSVNGTTSCNFEWVRYREDGSVHYIEGAKQPNYLVTADDVDSYLAIHVQPLDNRKRKFGSYSL